MTLLTYQMFKNLAEMGSVQKAAEIMGLTPSAVSHAISSMEKELGFKVVMRNKSGVRLTNHGEELLPYVREVLLSDEKLKRVVADFKGLARGKVKVGCFSSVCTNWMPDIIKSFGQLYPGIEIEVFQGTYDDVSYWIRTGICDFGFLSASSAGDLMSEPLVSDPLLCIVNKGFQKENDLDYMTIGEMKKLQFVTQRESTDADIQNFLRQNRLNVRSNCHVVDDLSTVAMVAAGFGICIMPELVMRDIPYEVRSYRIRPFASRIISLASLGTDGMAPCVKALYSHILKRYQCIT